ncbi:hypothetical protein V8E55_003824 [Tylopilus felleus]
MSLLPPPGIYVPAVLFLDQNEDLDVTAIKAHVLRLAQAATARHSTSLTTNANKPSPDTRREWLQARHHHRRMRRSVCKRVQEALLRRQRGWGRLRPGLDTLRVAPSDDHGRHSRIPSRRRHSFTSPVSHLPHRHSRSRPRFRHHPRALRPSNIVGTKLPWQTPPSYLCHAFLRIRHPRRCIRGPPSRSCGVWGCGVCSSRVEWGWALARRQWRRHGHVDGVVVVP